MTGRVELTNAFGHKITVAEEGLEPFLRTGWSKAEGVKETKAPAKKAAAKKTQTKKGTSDE